MIKNRKLSPNFTLHELIKSQTAKRMNIDEQFTPSLTVQHNLELLAKTVLQPMRDTLRFPIRVTSGYRCERLNSVVKGAKNSDHLYGLAADIEAWDESKKVLIKVNPSPRGSFISVEDKESKDTHLVYSNAAILLFVAYNLDGPYKQCIAEKGKPGNCSWVHASITLKDEESDLLIFNGTSYRKTSKEFLLSEAIKEGNR